MVSVEDYYEKEFQNKTSYKDGGQRQIQGDPRGNPIEVKIVETPSSNETRAVSRNRVFDSCLSWFIIALWSGLIPYGILFDQPYATIGGVIVSVFTYGVWRTFYG